MRLQEFFRIFETPFNLVELINIESGKLGISAAPLVTMCSECPITSSLAVDCETCNVNSETLISIRSGDGDGVYPVFQNWSSLAVGVWFDLAYAEAHRSWASLERGPAVDASLEANVKHLEDLEVFWAGTISTTGSSQPRHETQTNIALGDALAELSDSIAVGFAGSSGQVEILVAMDQSKVGNQSGFVPRLVFAVDSAFLLGQLSDEGIELRKLSPETIAAWSSMLVNGNLTSSGQEWALFQTYALRDSIANIIAEHQTKNRGIATSESISIAISAIRKLEQNGSKLASQLLDVVRADFGFPDEASASSAYLEEWKSLIVGMDEDSPISEAAFEGFVKQAWGLRKAGGVEGKALTGSQRFGVDAASGLGTSKTLTQAENNQPASGGNSDIVTQIQKLSEMLANGILSEDEFKAAKAKLLSN